MASSVKIFLLFLAIKETSTQKPDPIIRSRSGTIQGTYRKSFTGRMYSSYEGIPYAAPPIGELRFEVNFYFAKIQKIEYNKNSM